MQTQFAEALWSGISVLAGGAIGYGFGLVQQGALRRHERLALTGKLKSGWSVMPGSFRRVGYLVFALALVQIVCPLLFRNGCQWYVSAGLVAGYGATLFRQLRQKMALNK